MNMKLVKAVDAKQYQTKISIQDLLIWAIRDQKVLEWLDATQDKITSYKSNLAGIIAHLELGASIRNAVATDMSNDAMRVGFAVQSLGRDARRIVVDCARAGDEPYLLKQGWKHISPNGLDMPIKYDKNGKRRVTSCYGRDENGKVIRLNFCRIALINSDASMRGFQKQYDDWLLSLKLCTAQLSDLERFIISSN